MFISGKNFKNFLLLSNLNAIMMFIIQCSDEIIMRKNTELSVRLKWGREEAMVVA